MEIICGGKQDILRITGAGKVRDCRYRLSCHTVRSGELLLSTVSGRLVQLTDHERKLLEGLPAVHREEMDGLIREGFLVPEERCDAAELEKLRRVVRDMKARAGITAFTILPTTACNARCSYCYENGLKIASMTEETALRTVDFICRESVGRPVKLQWFGGEPLLGADIISLICSRLSGRGVDFESSMVTNGLLFGSETMKAAGSEWRLKKVQITLDGTAEDYERIKNYRTSIEMPFKRVTDNIEALLDAEIAVVIRMNLGEDNYQSLRCLTGQLARRFAGRKLLRISTAMLYGSKGLDGKLAALVKLIEESSLQRTGPETGLVSLAVSRCMADSDNAVLINPEGKLSRCEHDIFGCSIGTVSSGITAHAESEQWKERTADEACESCPFLPGCIRLVRCKAADPCSPQVREYKMNECIKAMKKAAELKAR